MKRTTALLGIIFSVLGIFCIFIAIHLLPGYVTRPSQLLLSPITSILPTPYPELTIDQIFTTEKSLYDTSSTRWSLVVTGDIIPARSVNFGATKRNDYLWAFSNIASLLSKGDITYTNLESPLLSTCPVTVEGMIFCGSTKHIEGLKSAGIDVVSFANNHIGNYGVKGIEETKALLEKNGILVNGIEGAVYTQIKGVKLAFLSYNEIGAKEPMVSWLDETVMKQEIIEAKKQADMVFVGMSWGIEYTDHPTDTQREIAKIAIDAGADMILGNHPHWVQGIEFYKGKLIMYALGNTIFDQMWSEETKKGMIGIATFDGVKLIDMTFHPTYIVDYGQSTLMTGTKKEEMIEYMKRVSFR